ncbi:MAG: hypothetical protein ACLFR1_11030, partial [Spirochaetia bacterium]
EERTGNGSPKTVEYFYNAEGRMDRMVLRNSDGEMYNTIEVVWEEGESNIDVFDLDAHIQYELFPMWSGSLIFSH